jgi:hypothetical protein
VHYNRCSCAPTCCCIPAARNSHLRNRGAHSGQLHAVGVGHAVQLGGQLLWRATSCIQQRIHLHSLTPPSCTAAPTTPHAPTPSRQHPAPNPSHVACSNHEFHMVALRWQQRAPHMTVLREAWYWEQHVPGTAAANRGAGASHNSWGAAGEGLAPSTRRLLAPNRHTTTAADEPTCLLCGWRSVVTRFCFSDCHSSHKPWSSSYHANHVSSCQSLPRIMAQLHK